MDLWPSEPQRQKRYFDEMSQQATLSPSPIHTFFSLANFSRFTGSASSSSSGPSHRRRFSHPHNPPQQSRRQSEDMAERSQTHQRPRLQHRASQTLTIDLTDEAEEAIAPLQNMDRAHSRRPPRLGRSDAHALENIIDLTEDNDVEITSSRQLPLPLPDVARIPPQYREYGSPELFIANSPPRRDINRVFANNRPLGAFDLGHDHAAVIMQFGLAAGRNFENMNVDHFQQFNNAQAMPGRMDYQRGAFADQKPDHLPPSPAKEGFTRSPTENDIVICPSCEEELVHRKDAEDLAVKKGGKAPTRKEREEHPFWVVKECGHVYCNKCYQNRMPSRKHPRQVSFPEKTSGKGPKKVPFCAVEDCPSEVKNKDKWVGIFL